MAGKLNYFVWLPVWTECLGGPIALNALANNLAILEEKAYGWGQTICPSSRAMLVPPGWHFEARPGDSCYIPSIPPITPDNSVFIHPEPVPPFWGGNSPKGAKHFVRWFLYHNSGVKVRESDIVFSWTVDFDLNNAMPHHMGNNKVMGMLQTYNAMTDEFFDEGLRRENECMIVRKGWYKTPDKHCQGAICLDGYRDNKTLRQVFNTTKRFICYDHNCFLPVQAAMCGCLPIVVPHPTLKYEKENQETYKYGVAYGFDEKEIKWAKETMHLARDHITNMEREGLRQTKEFVEICEGIVLNK